MIGRDKQAVKSDSRNGLEIGRPVRLSATMVDLSMRQDRGEPRSDIPPTFAKTAERGPEKANVQFINSTVAAIPEEKGNNTAQVDPGFGEASRKISRISMSPIVILVLVLLAFAVVLVAARGHRTDSVKPQSAIPATVEPREIPPVPVTTVASDSTHSHAHSVAVKKAKSRRRRDDYVAKDTYVYYGKQGKPNH